MLGDEELREEVTALIRSPCCRGECLVGKAAALENFVRNYKMMSRSEKRLCVMTSLSILFVAIESQPRRIRSTGERTRFCYHVPYVGNVCKTAFMLCFEVSAPTIARYKIQVRSGRLV
jgi:hypothetical protein